MLKYIKEDTTTVFREIPDEITLAINISNCQNNCKGCHSSYLKMDIGEELTESVLDELISKNDGITCVCFMGEGNDHKMLLQFADHISETYKGLKVAVYSGRNDMDVDFKSHFDYVKIGEYREDCGPLDSKTTNQRLYRFYRDKKNRIIMEDITNRFWS